VSLLLAQNEELYRSNESLKLNIEVMRQQTEEKDKHIALLEALLRQAGTPDHLLEPLAAPLVEMPTALEVPC